MTLTALTSFSIPIGTMKPLLKPYDSVTCMKMFKSRLWESN